MEKGKENTSRILKAKQGVSQEARENLKAFTRMKKAILDALKDHELTIPQLAGKLNLPAHEVMFHLMSLLKYGFVETGPVDDNDEYFYYKIKG